HNRDASNWTSRGGHYGHSQVPENTHWDPGYTQAELAIVTPEAILEAPRELTRTVLDSIQESVPRPTGDPEQIARRLLADALEQLHARSSNGRSRVRISVATGATRIEIDVDLGTPAGAASVGKRPHRRKPTSTS
ncbi:MAG TPA: hypothetical protein VFW45_04400, partial [Candidatus Polarisedimenticolia bacterium]|nr:hypothetical protein [Candidatus Polarisedimenticolia bacterium]